MSEGGIKKGEMEEGRKEKEKGETTISEDAGVRC